MNRGECVSAKVHLISLGKISTSTAGENRARGCPVQPGRYLDRITFAYARCHLIGMLVTGDSTASCSN